jgi:hypothetical protein
MPKGTAPSPYSPGLAGLKTPKKVVEQRKRSHVSLDGQVVLNEEVEEEGFFEEMLRKQEEELLARGEIEEEVNESFSTKTVESGGGYEKDQNPLMATPNRRVMKAKAVTEDKYNQALQEGMSSMHGHTQGESHMNSMGVLKFSNRIKFQTKMHKERDTDYSAMFEKAKARKNSGRIARQRQWASNWKQKYQPDEGGGAGLKAPWANRPGQS